MFGTTQTSIFFSIYGTVHTYSSNGVSSVRLQTFRASRTVTYNFLILQVGIIFNFLSPPNEIVEK